MWVFYLISLPSTLGMVIMTLRYFAGPDVPRYVLFTVAYTWFCSLSIIILVPADIWATISQPLGAPENAGISFFWSWSYWSTFLLTWVAVPLIQGFEDAGDFTVTERLKTSVHVNLIFYLVVGSIGLVGLILLILMKKNWSHDILGLAMGLSNTFGLVTGAFLLGFGLSEIPKSIWRNADWTIRQKLLSHRISKMAVKLDEAHQELSNVIVVAQATSSQMSKRDPLRPYMDVIDDMLSQMLRNDPSFKPQGGRFGENDMDYDTDEKSMATLRRQLRLAREQYYRHRSEYMNCVRKALELEDTMKNYERRSSSGWKYISSFRSSRSGKMGAVLDTTEFVWRCILRKQVEKILAIILGIMSAGILLAEATLLFSGFHLSLFSLLINSLQRDEVLVQVFAFVPLMYMCICTYYSLFKIGMLMFYSFTPRQTGSVSLLMICSMVARYAPPISYNFLNLINLHNDRETIFEKRMGNIDTAVSVFGEGFNRIYPLIMVVYTLLVAGNFFDRVVDFFGSWKRLHFQTEADDVDGFDPSGLIILQKERSWLEQGHKVGENVVPLARNFNGADFESVNNTDHTAIEMKAAPTSEVEGTRGAQTKSSKDEVRRYGASKDAISHKYVAIREQHKQTSDMKTTENSIPSAKVSLLDGGNLHPADKNGSPSLALASKWQSMKSGFQNFKANIGTKKFLPLRQNLENIHISRASSSDSLDEIFQRLKRPSVDHDDEDDNGQETEIRTTGPSR